MAMGAELFCMSGTALGAALATLFLGRQTSSSSDSVERELLKHMLMQQQLQNQALAKSATSGPVAPTPATSDGKAALPFPGTQNSEDLDEIAQAQHKDLNMNIGSWEGFSMEDARKRSELFRDKFKELAPQEVLGRLQRGNARFWTGHAVRPEKSAFERRALIMAQFPTTAVLGCSDSRVPVEVIFDQGLGDMFVVRVAGNVLETATKASLQYAVHHLKVKVLLVMGHEGCGAVKAAGLPLEKIEQEPSELAEALKLMKGGLNENRLKNVHDARAHDREAVVTNVRRQVEGLCQDAAIMAKVEAQELIVVGCFYEISSGIVDFFMEVTEAKTEQPSVVMRGKSSGVQSRIEYRKATGATPTGKVQRGKSDVALPDPESQPVKDQQEEAANGWFGKA